MEELVPLIIVLLLLAMIFGLALFVSQVQPMKALVHTLAYDCARAGVATLNAGRGLTQAGATAVEAASMGTYYNPAGLHVETYPSTVWGRGQVFVCEVHYNVRTDHLPMVSWFYAGGYVPLSARASMTIEPYQARWGGEAP
jgi:hypothetical protein